MFKRTKLFIKAVGIVIAALALPLVLIAYKMKSFITPESVEKDTEDE